VNLIAVTGIFYEINYFDEAEVDTSTFVTASLTIKFDNLDDNETKIFDLITTSESTAYGILMAAKNEGQYAVTISQTNNGLLVESIANWGNCDDCQKEEGYIWKYTINNLPSETAANRKVIENGDEVNWIYSQ